jgi:hypothetical protein
MLIFNNLMLIFNNLMLICITQNEMPISNFVMLQCDYAVYIT